MIATHGMQGSYDKLMAEVPKYKMITPSVLADRLRVSLSPLPACRVSQESPSFACPAHRCVIPQAKLAPMQVPTTRRG